MSVCAERQDEVVRTTTDTRLVAVGAREKVRQWCEEGMCSSKSVVKKVVAGTSQYRQAGGKKIREDGEERR
jgi:hypothetical protein